MWGAGERWRSEGEGEGGEKQREGQRCEAGSRGSLSDADRDTFAPELRNCVVWNWNGGASGAVICNKFQLLQHLKPPLLCFCRPLHSSSLVFHSHLPLSSHTSLIFLSSFLPFCPFRPPFLLSSSAVFARLVSPRPADRHVQAWQLTQRPGSSTTGSSHPLRASPPLQHLTKQQWQPLRLSASQRAELICLISYLFT